LKKILYNLLKKFYDTKANFIHTQEKYLILYYFTLENKERK